MKITIVTPCFDRATFLNDTISSVVSQKGDFEIEYIVQFSGNHPEVDSVLRQWEKRVSSIEFSTQCVDLSFTVFREPDRNMYDGLNKGFLKATGDVLAWINSDDLYHPGAFQTVSEVFRENDSIHWVSGIPNSFNSRGSRTGYDKSPKCYSREFIQRGYYRIENLKDGFNWIAQDCCFWTAALWKNAGGNLDDSYELAADFDLWRRFARFSDLVKIESFLGGYRFHGDQFTGNPQHYIEELPEHVEVINGYKRLRNLLIKMKLPQKYIFNRNEGHPWLKWMGLEWHWLVGRTAEWSFDENKWKIFHHPVL